MSDPALYLHAGAHRTGTSSFQMCSHENREMLDQAGWAVAYPGRDGIPSGTLALRLPGPKDDDLDTPTQKVARTLADHSGGRDMILSEENVIGRMMHFMQGLFYPAAQARAQVIRDAWPGPIAHVLLVVRPYGDLFASGYRKRAEDNAVPPFDTLRPNYMRMDRGWPELVAVLRDTLRPEQMTVLPYEKRGASTDLLARLVPGLPGAALIEPMQDVNVSATDAALEALQARYHAGDKLDRAAWKDVIEDHADDRERRGFAAFSDDEARVWQQRYYADLSRLAAMDGITLG